MSKNIDEERANKWKVFILTEEYEDRDGIRNFKNCLITFDKNEAIKMLSEFKKNDQYCYISQEGTLIDRGDYFCTKFNGNGYVEYKIDEFELDLVLPENLREGIVSMMKFMVSNSWDEAICKEGAYAWLSNGTSWASDFIKEISKNEPLFVEDYIDGRIGCPFREDFEKDTNQKKNTQKDLVRF